MDAVTYPVEEVAAFVEQNVIPLRVAFDNVPLGTRFNVKWTPTLVTLDTDGVERHRTVGFIGPDELIPSLLLGLGKSDFESERFDDAIAKFNRILSLYPKSSAAAEAVFLRGVALYKNTRQPRPLKEAYQTLVAKYPDSEWTKRAYPYRLIP
jgi:tetratricopeptide (TPR) repeat protein